MKKTMNMTIARLATIAMIVVALLFAFVAQNVSADERTIGTIEKVAEFRAEAIAEKSMSSVATIEAPVAVEVAAVENTVVNETVIAAPAVKLEETKEEVVTVNTTVENTNEVASTEFVEEFEMEMVAEIAHTAEAATTNASAQIIDAATTEASADGIEINFGETTTENTVATTAAKAETVKATVNTKNTAAKYLGTTGGTRKAITLVGDSTFRDIKKLQAAIDANNIVCYPNNDMTKGVKYFAGHNPGVMSHIAGLKVGSVVRLSNEDGYQDYRIMEIKAGSGSFATVKFNTTQGVMDAWTMLTRGTENAVIVQYCINGVSTLHYGVAIN